MKFSRLLIFFTIILAIFLFFQDNLLDIYSELSFRLPQIKEEIEGSLEKIEKQILTPPPLRIEKKSPESFLTQKGVFEQTNIKREKYGISKLAESERLNASAELKVKDMFKSQYFAHNSPLGIGVKDLAENVAYEFIIIGENLALGGFLNDKELLGAWMDSPGHRENILNSNYQEIGIAVAKGEFEGEVTWLAVQHFGTPLWVCDQPDETIKEKISLDQAQINESWESLNILETKMKSTRPKRGTFYREMVNEYNDLAVEYNTLISQAEFLIDKYNYQIRLFNECIASLK